MSYTREGKAAALGFSLDVDAMRVEIAPLDVASPAVREYLSSPPWRWQAFFRTVAEDPALAAAGQYLPAGLAGAHLHHRLLAGRARRPAPRPGPGGAGRRILA